MQTKRYSELDWLRVVLILAVFLHHVFMPFNGDGWHVMNGESSKLLDDIMVYFEQVRLQTLFFIAGAGSYLLLRKASAGDFLKSKFHRLFVPLIVGMMFIVPPQNYYENIGDYSSLADAYTQLVLSFEPNHLWFIEFLIVFMVLALPMQRLIDSKPGSVFLRGLQRLATTRHGLMSLALILAAMRAGLFYLMPEADGGIENLPVSTFYLFFFIAGMCFISSTAVWQSIIDNRHTSLLWLLVGSVAFYGYYYVDTSEYLSLETRWQLWWLVCTWVSWSSMLTMVGYAGKWFQHTPLWLRQANELIYPFYILHQTLIVAMAFYIVQWDASIALKSVSLLLGSFIACVLICFWVIRPFNILRYLFGLKPAVKQSRIQGSATITSSTT